MCLVMTNFTENCLWHKPVFNLLKVCRRCDRMVLVRGEEAEIYGKKISVKLLKMLVWNAANQMRCFRSQVLLMEGPVV